MSQNCDQLEDSVLLDKTEVLVCILIALYMLYLIIYVLIIYLRNLVYVVFPLFICVLIAFDFDVFSFKSLRRRNKKVGVIDERYVILEKEKSIKQQCFKSKFQVRVCLSFLD